MKTAAEYRAMAEECFRWAREAHTGQVRESYMELAQIWLKSAALVDSRVPMQAAPPDTPIKAA